MLCLSEHHILYSYLGSLQRRIKIKKIQHCESVPSPHTIRTMVSLLLCSHCPRRIRMAGHPARTSVFIPQISSYLLICCLAKWDIFRHTDQITVSDRKSELHTVDPCKFFGKVKKLGELMKAFQKCGELWSTAAKNTQKLPLKLPQPSVKKPDSYGAYASNPGLYSVTCQDVDRGNLMSRNQFTTLWIP